MLSLRLQSSFYPPQNLNSQLSSCASFLINNISVQSLSHVQIFTTPWTAAHQASLSITNSWILPKLMYIESVMPSNNLILSHILLFLLQSFPASGSFHLSQLFTSGGLSIGASAPPSVLLMNIQYWFPLGWTHLISLQSKGLSRVFSNTTQKRQFFSVQPSLWSNHSFDYRVSNKINPNRSTKRLIVIKYKKPKIKRES